jgi:hypothetical protein
MVEKAMDRRTVRRRGPQHIAADADDCAHIRDTSA